MVALLVVRPPEMDQYGPYKRSITNSFSTVCLISACPMCCGDYGGNPK
jgi:hypothetical protein